MLPRRRTNWLRLGWMLGVLMVGAWVLSLVACRGLGAPRHRAAGVGHRRARRRAIRRASVTGACARASITRSICGGAGSRRKSSSPADSAIATRRAKPRSASATRSSTGSGARHSDREQRPVDGGVAPTGRATDGSGADARGHPRERSVSHAATVDPRAPVRTHALHVADAHEPDLARAAASRGSTSSPNRSRCRLSFLLERRE